MTHPRLAARRVAKKITQVVGRYWGESFPFYYVSEYPKSGGTWLAQMVADYLQLPLPRHSIFPIGFKAVIFNHWPYDAGYHRPIYLHRDGRDVMTSFFFHRLRIAQQPDHPAHRTVTRYLQRLFGKDYGEREASSMLATFIEEEFENPGLGSRLNWADHVRGWGAPADHPHVAYVSYEALLANAEAEMARVIEEVTGQAAGLQRIRATVEKFSMNAQTGRVPGQEDKGHHIRKGIAGDWKNHFTRQAAEVFRRKAGDILIALGYETDPGWVERDYAAADER